MICVNETHFTVCELEAEVLLCSPVHFEVNLFDINSSQSLTAEV